MAFLETRLGWARDTRTIKIKPSFQLILRRSDNATGQHIQDHTLMNLPLPVMEDVDGGGDPRSIGDIEYYLWDDWKVFEPSTMENTTGHILSFTNSVSRSS